MRNLLVSPWIIVNTDALSSQLGATPITTCPSIEQDVLLIGAAPSWEAMAYAYMSPDIGVVPGVGVYPDIGVNPISKYLWQYTEICVYTYSCIGVVPDIGMCIYIYDGILLCSILLMACI